MRVVICIALLLLASCATQRYTNSIPPVDAVFHPDQSATFQVGSDRYAIRYTGPDSRFIMFNDVAADVSMIVRARPFVSPFDIFPAEQGIYNPADTAKLGHDLSSVRIIYRESILRFADEEQFAKFIRSGSAVRTRIYGDNGILISVSNGHAEHFDSHSVWQVISISVWQVFIDDAIAAFDSKAEYRGRLLR